MVAKRWGTKEQSGAKGALASFLYNRIAMTPLPIELGGTTRLRMADYTSRSMLHALGHRVILMEPTEGDLGQKTQRELQ